MFFRLTSSEAEKNYTAERGPSFPGHQEEAKHHMRNFLTCSSADCKAECIFLGGYDIKHVCMWVSAMHLIPVIPLKEVFHSFFSSLLPDSPWTIWFLQSFSVQSFFFFFFYLLEVMLCAWGARIIQTVLFSAAKLSFVPPFPSLSSLSREFTQHRVYQRLIFTSLCAMQMRKGFIQRNNGFYWNKIDIYIYV